MGGDEELAGDESDNEELCEDFGDGDESAVKVGRQGVEPAVVNRESMGNLPSAISPTGDRDV